VIADLVHRDPPLLLAVALYGAFACALGAWAGACLARRGGPWRWTPTEVYGFVAVAVVGSFGWFWVDRPVEGRATWVWSATHGITTGDLLALPAAAAAVVVLVASRWSRAPHPAPAR
jgi:hypothetical protein